MGIKLVIILLLGILLINGVYAAEFSITSVTKQSSGTPYRGDSVSYKGIIQADSGNICKIECSYQVGSDSGYVSDNGGSPATQLSKGVSQEFPFSIPAEGSVTVNTNLVVTCNRIPNYINCWPGSTSQQKSISFSFFYQGDGTCTTSKEKCADYGTFLKDDACSCPYPLKECRPNGTRKDLDEKGCQTYCGNGVCEKSEGESCVGSASGGCSDCKKCDLSTCSLGNECEGGYCVWGVCWHSSTRLNDGHCNSDKGENCGNSLADCKCSDNERCDNSLKKCLKITCGNDICDFGESFTSCPNDCKQESFKDEVVNPDTDYPIIFVHGHSVQTEQVSTFSINAFAEFQNKLTSDGLYYDKGVILPNSEPTAFNFGEWGRLDKHISVRTTYYIGTLDSSGTFIQSSETTRSINEYAERLGKVVDIVLHHTGKKKVILIAHSMGGIVSRAYIKNGGESKVDKLITIGTPNHGIWNLDGWNWGCLISHQGVECTDMQHDSTFISQLNNVKISPSIKVITIAGFCGKSSKTGAEYDEVIRVNSVKLKGATNKVIKRNGCISGTDTYHGYLVSPSKVPETYSYVIDFLKN